MTKLHTFGCSITQGFALPDVVQPVLDPQGQPYTPQQIRDLGIEINWEDIHLYKPSEYAWPSVLAQKLGVPVENHARRGACFQQIARQCVVGAKHIQPDDAVIVMWTYLSRLSLQWPARTTVPFCNIVDPNWNWSTVILGFNRFFGLSKSTKHTLQEDAPTQQYIENSVRSTYLDPRGIFNSYYNNLVLQVTVDGLLRSTGARVLHLSVEPEPYTLQLESARQELDESLREPWTIPHPDQWYNIDTDHDSCRILHDPSIPPAENDMHPSVTHHKNFADAVHQLYFS